MNLQPDFFRQSFLGDLFKLTDRDFDYLLKEADPQLRSRLMMLEAWGQIFFVGLSPECVRDRLGRHLSFRSF
jgi:hypothetical protein